MHPGHLQHGMSFSLGAQLRSDSAHTHKYDWVHRSWLLRKRSVLAVVPGWCDVGGTKNACALLSSGPNLSSVSGPGLTAKRVPEPVACSIRSAMGVDGAAAAVVYLSIWFGTCHRFACRCLLITGQDGGVLQG